MRDYGEAIASFDPAQEVARVLSGGLEAMNACTECCDRHAASGRTALVWEGRDGEGATFTFAQLSEQSARCACFLRAQGVQPGDRIAGLLPRVPELLVTMLGAWRAGAVYLPLFTAFGPRALEYRLRIAGPKLVVTDPANRSKLEGLPGCPPIAVVSGPGGQGLRSGDFSFRAELEARAPEFPPVQLGGDAPFLMLFTSGTTGPAKPLLVPLKAIVPFVGYLRDCVDLRPEDGYWNIADPGWAYGLYYAVIGPLAMGHATTLYEGPFTVESTCRVIRKLGITNLAGSPTAYRLLIAGGDEVVKALKGRLRAVSSAGEPLNPEVIRWFADQLSTTIHDHYGQTELGMVLCNHHALRHPIHLGSAGYSVPGHRVVVVDEAGERENPAGKPGILALDRSRSPLLWFTGYWNQATPDLRERYYLSGDTTVQNADGSITFVGRSDDVITSAGYRIGPFEVESALLEHPAVMESAVVGKPDAERTEIVKAFVKLKPRFVAGPALAEELRQHVRQRLSLHSYPREIEFVSELPKTESGKLQRFVLRRQEVERLREAKAALGTS